MENPIKMDDLGVPLFLETPKYNIPVPWMLWIYEVVVSVSSYLTIIHPHTEPRLTPVHITHRNHRIKHQVWGAKKTTPPKIIANLKMQPIIKCQLQGLLGFFLILLRFLSKNLNRNPFFKAAKSLINIMNMPSAIKQR